MTTPIESITTAALSVALSAGAARQSAIAANIANANVEGYVPLRLAFDTSLDDAQAALREKGWLDAGHLPALRGELEPALDVGGVPLPVRLDEESAELARNAVHFQALTQALSRHLGMLALAAADGRK